MAKGASADRWNGGGNVKASAAAASQLKLCFKGHARALPRSASAELRGALAARGRKPEDQEIPLRAFHGFAEFHPVPYHEAIEKLRHAAQSLGRQDDAIGA